MILHDIKQGTDEWLSVRRGKFTASICADLFATKTTLTYQKAIYKVAFERCTGESPESFKSEYMQRGNELEPYAIEQYENETFNKVNLIGFVEQNEFIGCSPDGLIGSDGMVQIKCPAFNTHIEGIISQKVPKDYELQVQFEMMVTGRKWSDLYFFHPKLKSVLIRVERNDEVIKLVQVELKTAIDKVNSIIDKIRI